MPAMDPKAVVKQFIETLGQERLDNLDDFFTADFVNHDRRPDEAEGHLGLAQALRQTKQAYPDFHVDPIQMIAEGDRVAVQVRATGTQRGEYMGRQPTNQPTTWEGFVIFRVENGKLAERWAKIDYAGTPETARGPSITMMPTAERKQPAK